MIDLSSPEMQRTFKKLQRTSLTTNILMCAFTAFGIGITIWASTLGPRDSMTWAETTFFVLIGLIILFFAGILAWEFIIRKSYKRSIFKYLAQGFYSQEKLLNGTEVTLELMLAGDKLAVMRHGEQDVLQFDLAPVKSYTSVCAYIVRCSKVFLREYYFNAAQHNALGNVELIDNVHGKTKKTVLIENGVAANSCKSGYCIKNGIIK
ncbi:MAG: hypothetical protein K2N14_03955 [Clostridia bacterium]|nr:hypothetical protein [Clostridia bacterium]